MARKRGSVMNATIQAEQAQDSGEFETFGDRLKYARKYVRLGPDEVATCLGIPVSSVHEIEMGKRYPSESELKKMSKLYLRPVNYLVSGVPVVPVDPDELFANDPKISEQDRRKILRFAEFLAGLKVVESDD